METLYATMILAFTQTRIDNFCENAFWNPAINKNDRVIELCEENVWKNTYFNSYNK